MNESYEYYNVSDLSWDAENWTNISENALRESQQPTYELSPLVTFMYVIVGIIGNSLVCIAISLDRKLQNLTNYFLLSLAITDLLVSILILPARLAMVRYVLPPSLFPLCFLYLVGDDFITAASAMHICFISLGRYFAIKNPLNTRNLTKRRVALKIGLVWLISFLTVIPYMTLAIISKQENHPEYCSNLLANFDLFDVIVFIEALVIVIMIVIVVVSFILTTRLLRQLAKKQQENASNGDSGLTRTVGGKKTEEKSKNGKSSQALQSEEKALRVVWLVSFAFIICMAPYITLSYSYYFFPDVIIPPILLEITAYLLYANSVINPIIYTIFNKTFRDDFKNIVLCKYKNK